MIKCECGSEAIYKVEWAGNAYSNFMYACNSCLVLVVQGSPTSPLHLSKLNQTQLDLKLENKKSKG